MACNARLFSRVSTLPTHRTTTSSFYRRQYFRYQRRTKMTAAGTHIVLVSGANQGLGYEIVKRLAATQENYHVLLGSRSLEKGEQALKKLRAETQDAKSSVELIQLDVSSDESVASCIQRVQNEHGRLDVLINNTGISPKAPDVQALPSTREKWARILDTNVTSLALLTDACLPLLRKSDNPRIVNMSSSLGSITYRIDPKGKFYGIGPPAYNASKAAVNCLTAIYAQRLADDGFQVNCCCPGFRRTAMNDFMDIAEDPAEGAIVPVRLAALEKGSGTNGKFIDLDGDLPW